MFFWPGGNLNRRGSPTKNDFCIIFHFQVLPALQSFCIYCSVGLTLIYLLQATTFVAGLTLDIRRMDAKRSGMLFCIKHDVDTWKPNKLSQVEFGKVAFSALGKVLTTKIGKVRKRKIISIN